MDLLPILALTLVAAEPLAPGNHFRILDVNGVARSYTVHVPPQYDHDHATPVVLAFHGAATNGPIMALSTGLSEKADEAGFVVVYPNGTGKAGIFLVWNSGGFVTRGNQERPDDVVFVAKMLDDLATVVHIDRSRVYATGMSNGGMMCYRLAADLSDRIAAIAPVAGTMAGDSPKPGRPVPVIHFHGTEDRLVPYEGPAETAKHLSFSSVEKSIRTWARVNGCPDRPQKTDLPDTADDGTTVTREAYGPGREGAEVILYTIRGGGHTWPGRDWPMQSLGKSTHDIAANDLIWEFFERHSMK